MPQFIPQISDLAAHSAVVQDHPDVVLAGILADHEYPTDPMDFFKRFGVSYETVKEEGYTPLFLAITNSQSGEEAESFGLFQKPGKKGIEYFEVLGTECSVWDFNGQWEPELTTPAVLWHRLDKGHLGMRHGEDDVFNAPLKSLVEQLDPSLTQSSAKPGSKSEKRAKRKNKMG